MMKKLLTYAITITIVLSVIYVSPQAAHGANTTLTLTPSSQVCAPGDEITLTLSISNNTGIKGMVVTPKIVKGNLTANQVTITEMAQADNLGYSFMADKNIVLDNTSDLTSNGNICTIKIKVADDAAYGDYKVDIVKRECISSSSTDVPLTIVPATITVKGASENYISDVSVVVEQELKLKLYTHLEAGVEAKIRATNNVTGKSEIINLDDNGTAAVRIVPQHISHGYKLELIDKNNQVLYEKASYSLKDYCESLANDPTYAKNTEVKTLVADILNYGIAAQNYVGEQAEPLPTWATTSISKFTKPATNFAKTGTGDAGASVNSVTLVLSDKTYIKYVISATDTTNLTAKLYRKTPTGEYLVKNNVAITDDNNVVMTNGIFATDMSDSYRLELYRSGEQIMSVTYSIASYVNSHSGAEVDASLAALCKALWCYGQSAKAYAAK